MIETYLLHTEPSLRIRVKSVTFETLNFLNSLKESVMHMHLTPNRKELHLIQKVAQYTVANLETQTQKVTSPNWKKCKLCSGGLTGFFRLIKRPNYDVIMLWCGCGLKVKFIANGEILGVLEPSLDDKSFQNNSVFYGKHLWYDSERLMFRPADSNELIQYFWKELDNRIYDKKSVFSFPGAIKNKKIADIFVGSSLMLAVTEDGHFALQIGHRKCWTYPPLEPGRYWNNPIRLPSRRVLVNSIKTNVDQTIFLASSKFKVLARLEVSTPESSVRNIIERLQLLHSCKRSATALAVANYKYAGVVQVRGLKIVWLTPFISMAKVPTCTAIGEIIAMDKKGLRYAFTVGNFVYTIQLKLARY